MTEPRQQRSWRLLATLAGVTVLGLAALASLGLAAGGAPAGGAAGRDTACKSAAAPVADSTVRELRKSIRCLINEERAIRELGKLAPNVPLRRAARRHTKAMVATRCLAHRCPGEPKLERRLRRAGYFDGAQTWRYAENTGCGLSAEAMVANWMASAYHRVNILDEDFRDIGVGASQRRVAGRCDKGYGTFAVVFGRRTP